MKALIIIGGWLVGYAITLFFFMLILRLLGDSPEEVYGIDSGNAELYLLIGVVWPLFLLCELLYLIWRFLKKWFVFAIELIVASKEIKEEEK